MNMKLAYRVFSPAVRSTLSTSSSLLLSSSSSSHIKNTVDYYEIRNFFWENSHPENSRLMRNFSLLTSHFWKLLIESAGVRRLVGRAVSVMRK